MSSYLTGEWEYKKLLFSQETRIEIEIKEQEKTPQPLSSLKLVNQYF